ncbi:NUDIX hydrolase [Luteococcus sp. Sow4_B9]|uniref:NUDIX hydrolase n=1 Tax=Luteococcus sp. Sow4_B9 TaxID=3438792 RepID=UPI003F99EC47
MPQDLDPTHETREPEEKSSAPGTQPLIIVSAVVLRDEDGRILTVRKRGTSRFMLVGGKHEPGESPADAAIRECGEEVSLELHADTIRSLGVFEAAAANEPDHLLRSHVFTHPLTGTPQPAAEIEEIRWLDPGQPLPGDLAPMLQFRVLPALGL